jgi:hypothetical protein
MKQHWRLFEEKNGELYTLFHGINGSRHVPAGKWLTAEIKTVYDGSNKRSYQSGFHVFANRYAVVYANRFTAPRRIVAVVVDIKGKTWLKPTNPDILLVQKMRVPEDWRDKRSIIKDH